ncbi:DUF1659 domain-containing protein [Bacillus tianshenii]|nr:DUF1659 domain-containing protein [Bacillus tianshenii]
MAQEFILGSRLTVTYDAGIDGEGNPIEKSKTYSNVKETATAEALVAVSQALDSLTQYNMIQIERQNTYELAE